MSGGEPEGGWLVASRGANTILGCINWGIGCKAGNLPSLVRSRLGATLQAAVALR